MPFTGLEGLEYSILISEGGSLPGYGEHLGSWGVDQIASLKLMVEDLEKDVSKWYCLNDSDLISSVEEELKHLSEQMQKTYATIQVKAKMVF